MISEHWTQEAKIFESIISGLRRKILNTVAWNKWTSQALLKQSLWKCHLKGQNHSLLYRFSWNLIDWFSSFSAVHHFILREGTNLDSKIAHYWGFCIYNYWTDIIAITQTFVSPVKPFFLSGELSMPVVRIQILVKFLVRRTKDKTLKEANTTTI